MTKMDYLKLLVDDIHSTTVATIGSDGHPQTRLRVISWQRTAKSNNYHVCRSRVNAADIWRERACTLSVEVSQRFH